MLLRYCYVCNEFTSSLFDEVGRIKEGIRRTHPNDGVARAREEAKALHYRFQKPSADLKDVCRCHRPYRGR